MDKQKNTLSKKRSVDLYFAFPDGVLDYSCFECNGLCCKDYGLTDNIRKGPTRILEIYPAFASAATGIESTFLEFSTAEKCFFLDEDNLCRIEKEHGKEYKMDLCNIFPFNSLYDIGHIVAVAPNYLCPMQLKLPSQPCHVKGTHREIRDIVLDSELREVKSNISSFHETESPEEFLKNEKDFRDVCQNNIGRRPFINTLAEMSNQTKDLKAFLRSAELALNFNNGLAINSSAYIDDFLHALSPSLRLTMNRLSAESRIKALLIFERILRRLLTLRNTPATLKSVDRLYNNLGPAVRLLALDKEILKVPKKSDGKINLPSRLSYGPLVLAAHAAITSGEKGKTTIECLETALDDKHLTTALRSAFLVEFGLWIESLL